MLSLIFYKQKNIFFSCHNHYDGDQCQTQLIIEYTSSEHKHKNGVDALWVILIIIVLLIVVTATTYYFTKLRRR